MTDRRRVAWYGATVFFASALLMVLEIVAGRLIAPYVGVSLYTWTSVIGVILAGLSLGNWIGGVWADRGGDERAVGLTLGLASVASFTILLLLTLIAPWIQAGGFGLLGASFLLVLTLFFVPALLLGIVTPILTTLALHLDTRTGHIVGRMHALAAVGSIGGTFLAGYLLIQYFGTRMVLIGCAAALFALALPFLRAARKMVPVALLLAGVAISAATFARQGFLNPCDRESQYYCIRVVDASQEVSFGRARGMVIDHLLHGINHARPDALVSPYVHLMDELVLQRFGPRAREVRYFFAGGGAFTQPRAVRAVSPRASVTVAELDPAVTAIAEQQLWVSTAGMRILHQDARAALAGLTDERFEVVVGDVYHDISAPYHLTTREYARLVKSRLTEDGLYLLNILDAYPDPLLVKSIVKTLQREFRHVDIWLHNQPDGPTRTTFVISASESANPAGPVVAAHGFHRSWERATDLLLGQGTQLARLPELTDDFVPVERLVSSLLLGGLGQ